MHSLSEDEKIRIVKDYLNGATYKELIKKYNRGSTVIHKTLSTFKADWFDLAKVNKDRRIKYPKLPDNIEEIAEDYKNGMSYAKLREKYGYKQHALHKFFKEFEKKVDWFDLKSISKFHSMPKNKGKKYRKHADADTASVYSNFLNTLTSCGLSETESWAVMNFLLRKTDANYYSDQLTNNKEIINQIIKKANLKSLETAFLKAAREEASL